MAAAVRGLRFSMLLRVSRFSCTARVRSRIRLPPESMRKNPHGAHARSSPRPRRGLPADLYLFRKLRERTQEMDEVITELQRHHFESKQLVKEMEQALADYKAGAPDGPAAFAQAVEHFAKAQWHHMIPGGKSDPRRRPQIPH